MSMRLLHIVIGCLLLAAGAYSAGCKSGSITKRSPLSDVQVQELIAFHNDRTASIERLWARVSVRIKGKDARGEWFEEQGEGHLQITQPSKVSLAIGKLGETYFAYGSNGDQYWMYDLSDSDRRVALIGAIDQLTPARASEIGLSVHPGDLISTVGIQSIDPDEIIETRWEDESQTLVVVFPSRWGSTEYWFDPSRGVPVMVRSLDDDDNRLATTGLTRYKAILADNKLETDIMIPGKVEVRDPKTDGGYIRIELDDPSQRSIRSMVYNPDRLSRNYRVHETIDLDEQSP